MKLHFLFFVYVLSAIAAEGETKDEDFSTLKESNKNSDGDTSRGSTQGDVIGNIFRTAIDLFPQSRGTEYESALDVVHCSHCVLRDASPNEFCQKFCVTTVRRARILPIGTGDLVQCDVCLYNSLSGGSCVQHCKAGQLARILSRLMTSGQSFRSANIKSSNSTTELKAETPQARADKVTPSPLIDAKNEEDFSSNHTDIAANDTLPSVE